jgi:hypothetical protein
MTGGLRETASLMAIAALTCVMGATVFVAKPAKAADLGGDCCADLEERVADLEATTARKGNKKVSVQIYGKMNWATMFWDDGGEQNVYTVNNYNDSSRTGIKGKAKIVNDWEAGYRLEWEYRHAASSRVNQFDDDNAFDNTSSINVRWSQMYLANKTYGTLNLGLTAAPKYDITKWGLETISTEPGEGGGLSDTLVADFRMNPNFRLRPTGFNNAEGLSTLTWSNIARCYSSTDQYNCSTRRHGVSYASPEWKGFSTQWGWFEDDDWGGALRYKSTFAPWGGGSGASSADTWQLSAGVAYEKLRDERLQAGGGGLASGNVIIPTVDPTTGAVASLNKTTFFQRDFDEWAGSVGLKHKPSGLFGVGIFSTSASDDTNAIGFFTGKRAPDMSAWDAQAGIQRKFSLFGLDSYGDTAFWGGYGQVNDGFAQGSNGGNTDTPCTPGSFCATGGGPLGGVRANGILPVGTFANIDTPVQITGSEVNRWFLALDQSFESAAFHLYAAYQHFDADVSLVTRNVVCEPACKFGKLRNVPERIDDFDLFYTGGRIYF